MRDIFHFLLHNFKKCEMQYFIFFRWPDRKKILYLKNSLIQKGSFSIFAYTQLTMNYTRVSRYSSRTWMFALRGGSDWACCERGREKEGGGRCVSMASSAERTAHSWARATLLSPNSWSRQRAVRTWRASAERGSRDGVNAFHFHLAAVDPPDHRDLRAGVDVFNTSAFMSQEDVWIMRESSDSGSLYDSLNYD